MEYNLAKHHEHEVLVQFFTFIIHQAGQIEATSRPVLAVGPMFDLCLTFMNEGLMYVDTIFMTKFLFLLYHFFKCAYLSMCTMRMNQEICN